MTRLHPFFSISNISVLLREYQQTNIHMDSKLMHYFPQNEHFYKKILGHFQRTSKIIN